MSAAHQLNRIRKVVHPIADPDRPFCVEDMDHIMEILGEVSWRKQYRAREERWAALIALAADRGKELAKHIGRDQQPFDTDSIKASVDDLASILAAMRLDPPNIDKAFTPPVFPEDK